ncbi:fungal-specific transcription factor domain-containing protein [Spinellus fusiger]|nr:fungal-specific transcription factor domain-containing protein [Spinellus fusiger]
MQKERQCHIDNGEEKNIYVRRDSNDSNDSGYDYSLAWPTETPCISTLAPIPMENTIVNKALVASLQFILPNAVFSLIADAEENLNCKEGKEDFHKITGGYDIENASCGERNSPSWVQDFFCYFNQFFPVLCRYDFLFTLNYSPESVNPLLKLAVYMVGLYYSKEDNTRECQNSLEQCLILLQTQHASLPTIQALIIMSWYTYLCGKTRICRSLRRQLMYWICDMQLEQDPAINIPQSEMHRRAFWVAFVTDQWIAGCTGERWMRPHMKTWTCQWPTLEDQYISSCTSIIDIPIDNDHQQITNFQEMIKLAYILGDMYEDCCASTNYSTQLYEARLTEWYSDLALDNGIFQKNLPFINGYFYHIMYYTAQIMIHRVFPRHHHQIKWSQSICKTAAANIIQIAEQMKLCKQERYLLNHHILSLTLTCSIYLDGVVMYPVSCTSQSFEQSIHLLKRIHRSPSPAAFEYLLDQFLLSKTNYQHPIPGEKFPVFGNVLTSCEFQSTYPYDTAIRDSSRMIKGGMYSVPNDEDQKIMTLEDTLGRWSPSIMNSPYSPLALSLSCLPVSTFSSPASSFSLNQSPKFYNEISLSEYYP